MINVYEKEVTPLPDCALYSCTLLPVIPFTFFQRSCSIQSKTNKQKIFRHSLLYYEQSPPPPPMPNVKSTNTSMIASTWRQQQWQQVLTQALAKQMEEEEAQPVDSVVDGDDMGGGTALATYCPLHIARLSDNLQLKSKSKNNYNFVRAYELEEQTKLLQQKMMSLPSYDYYYSNESYRSSSDCGSGNLLVTFDYGYSDSLLEEVVVSDDVALMEKKQKTHLALADDQLHTVYSIEEEFELNEINVWGQQKPKVVDVLNKYENDDYSDSWEQTENEVNHLTSKAEDMQIWFNTALTRAQQQQQQASNERSTNELLMSNAAAFKVHHMQHAPRSVDTAEDEYEYEYEDESLNSVVEQNAGRGESSPSAGSSANSFYYRQLALGDWGQETVVDDDDDDAVDANNNNNDDDDDDGDDDDDDDDDIAQFVMPANNCMLQSIGFADLEVDAVDDDSAEFYDSLN